MADTFLDYLRRERRRIDCELQLALAKEAGDRTEIASLRRLRRVVDDQLASWSRDLCSDRMAA
jgi:hypothetical protein